MQISIATGQNVGDVDLFTYLFWYAMVMQKQMSAVESATHAVNMNITSISTELSYDCMKLS